MRRFRLAMAMLTTLLLVSGGIAGAQTADKDLVKKTLKEIFERIHDGDVQGLEGLVVENVEMFDSTYPLRIEGRGDLKDYIDDMGGAVSDLKTSIRQVTVRIFGAVAVVSFYYSQDYVLVKGMAGEGADREELSAMRERATEVGRGTAVFVKSKEKWQAVSIHLSQFPEPIF